MEESKNLEQNLDNGNKKLHISDVIKRTKYTFDEVSKPGSLSRERSISTFADSLKEAEDWFRNNYKGWIYQIVEWKQEYV
jgi:hypothetical protein